MTKTVKTKPVVSKIEIGEWRSKIGELLVEINTDLQEQKETLIEMGNCSGTCECELGYENGETYECKHCFDIRLSFEVEERLESFITNLLTLQAQQQREEMMEMIGEDEDAKKLWRKAGDSTSFAEMGGDEMVGRNQLRSELREKLGGKK